MKKVKTSALEMIKIFFLLFLIYQTFTSLTLIKNSVFNGTLRCLEIIIPSFRVLLKAHVCSPIGRGICALATGISIPMVVRPASSIFFIRMTAAKIGQMLASNFRRNMANQTLSSPARRFSMGNTGSFSSPHILMTEMSSADGSKQRTAAQIGPL